MSNRIFYLRKEFGLKQKDIADVFETTSTNIGNYETERRDMSTEVLLKFSDYFGVSCDYLLEKSTSGIIVYDSKDDTKYSINEGLLLMIKENNCLSYNGLKRVVDFAKLFENSGDVSLLLSILSVKNKDYVNQTDITLSKIISHLESMDNNKLDVILSLLKIM